MRSPLSRKHPQITEKATGAFSEGYKCLRYGFLEKVCESALAIELGLAGLHVVQKASIQVRYRGVLEGEYFADWCEEVKVREWLG